MPIPCDTLRLTVGRPGPFATSARFLTAADVREIRGQAERVARTAPSEGGAGFVLASGRRVILRRMPSGSEVRGLIVDSPYADEAALALLGNSPFWAGTHFEGGRPVRAPLDEGEAPRRWWHGGDGRPEGFEPLAAPEGDGLPHVPGFRGQTIAGTAAASCRAPAPGPSRAARRPAPQWVLLACAAATAASVLFMAISVGASWLGRAGLAPAAPVTAPPTGSTQ